MAPIGQINSTIENSGNFPDKARERFWHHEMRNRPYQYAITNKDHDRLRNPGLITKTKAKIETALNTPGYAYRGMKGDPDFNFFESQKVSKIPYYLGGLGLAGIALCGKNSAIPNKNKAGNAYAKKIFLGVLMYYIARTVANAVIDIPMKIFRGIDLNRPYRKITSLREGNPLGLPNNKKPSNQNAFESSEFTRWDLFYKYGKGQNINETFDKLAKKFGAKHPMKDADSSLMGKIRKMIVMTTAWKTALSIPFIMVGLGLAQQKSFEQASFRSFFKNTGNLFKPSTKNRFLAWSNSFKSNILKPLGEAFVSLWKGTSLTSKILGRGAILSAIGISILANVMILNKTSLKNENNKIVGGNK